MPRDPRSSRDVDRDPRVVYAPFLPYGGVLLCPRLIPSNEFSGVAPMCFAPDCALLPRALRALFVARRDFQDR
jgi:hypothetical protein